MKICIIYIAIGEYEKLWDIFYPSCQAFFCVDAEKGYELFTDSKRLFDINYPNVYINQVPDKGFIVNASSKSKFMLTIENRLKGYDYIFYLNGDFRFLSPIYTQEVIPPFGRLAFTALSFDEYSNKSPKELPYDRNPLSGAYISEKLGKRYYQGGFFGGSYEEIMKYNHWAVSKIENDLRNGIIARFHDESYLNKYLIDKEPHIVNNQYAAYTGTNYKGKIKAELIDKASFLGKEKLFKIRDRFFQTYYSCIMENDGEISKLGVVRVAGGLGNQLFILAFYYYMQDVLKVERQLLIDPSLYENYHFHSGFELQRLFKIKDEIFLSSKLKKKLSTVPMEVIYEEDNSVFQEIKESESEIILLAVCGIYQL